MRVLKRVSGILSILLYFVVMFRSMGSFVARNGKVSGGVGMVVAVFMLVGGILFIKSEKKSKKENLALTVVYGGAGFIGLLFAGSSSELCIWAIWCFYCASLAVVSVKRA